MSESKQEGYQTLGWIINKSEQGLFIVVADEKLQKEIAEIYRQGIVEIYDYKRQAGEYSFRALQEWVMGRPEIQNFMLLNFHLAVQNEESIKRLNFSRDMIEKLGKNFIFLVTPNADDRLAVQAYDFYSFVKLRIVFHAYEIGDEKDDKLFPVVDMEDKDREWDAYELKQKNAEAHALIEQAKEEKNKSHYDESENLLLKARQIKEKALGTEHLEIAAINYEIAEVYEKQGKYQKAEILLQKSLEIREKVLGEEHPDTAACYSGLSVLYAKQENYEIALTYSYKAFEIFASIFGRNHTNTQHAYENLEAIYTECYPGSDFEQWLKEKMKK